MLYIDYECKMQLATKSRSRQFEKKSLSAQSKNVKKQLTDMNRSTDMNENPGNRRELANVCSHVSL